MDRNGLRHVLQEAALGPARRVRDGVRRFREKRSTNESSPHPPPMHSVKEEFWALRDISLEITQRRSCWYYWTQRCWQEHTAKDPEPNYRANHRRIGIKGRVASLLEVGTGFHPDLTGRENVFLNGAILGMSRREIVRHFDEIVDFAAMINSSIRQSNGTAAACTCAWHLPSLLISTQRSWSSTRSSQLVTASFRKNAWEKLNRSRPGWAERYFLLVIN